MTVAVGFGLVLWQYILGGPGQQDPRWDIWSGDVVVGLVQVTGLFLAFAFCFVIGIYFIANGLIPFQKTVNEQRKTPDGNTPGPVVPVVESIVAHEPPLPVSRSDAPVHQKR